MQNRYVLFKTHLNSISYRTFESLETLDKEKSHSEYFNGDYVATYDLQEGKYLDFPDVHGLGSHLEKLLADAKEKYSQG